MLQIHGDFISGNCLKVKWAADYLGLDYRWIETGVLKNRGHGALKRLDEALATSDYLVGERCSLADIALVAYTRVAHEGGFDLGLYPAVQAWIRRVETDLGISNWSSKPTIFVILRAPKDEPGDPSDVPSRKTGLGRPIKVPRAMTAFFKG